MSAHAPLADRICPETLDEFVGQQHLVGPGKPLYLAAHSSELHSMIFWGPPATTTGHSVAIATLLKRRM